MLLSYYNVFIFLVVGGGFVIVALILSRIIQPRNESVPEKYLPYECGENPIGDAWIRFNNRFYLVALVFLIFDVEIAFMYPWALVFQDLGLFAFIEMMIFIAILLVGFIYIWVRGDLGWIKPFIFTGNFDEMHRKAERDRQLEQAEMQ